MKILLTNADEIDLPFCSTGLAGYVAKRITFNGTDVRAMRAIYQRDPADFIRYLVQLEARFEENRMPGVLMPAPEAPLTASRVADALDAFWNAAIGEARNQQVGDALATASVMAEGFRAVAEKLREGGA